MEQRMKVRKEEQVNHVWLVRRKMPMNFNHSLEGEEPHCSILSDPPSLKFRGHERKTVKCHKYQTMFKPQIVFAALFLETKQ